MPRLIRAITDDPDMTKMAVERWADLDPRHLFQFLYSESMLPAGSPDRLPLPWKVREILFDRWMKSDPAGLETGFRSALGPALVRAWAETDPTAAIKWSEQHLASSARAGAIFSVIDEVARRDLNHAAELAATLEPGENQTNAVTTIFETWIRKGPEERDAALTWLSAVPDPEARKQAMSWSGNWFSDLGPDAVREFLDGPHGKLVPSSAVHQIASREASKDPEAALRWADSLAPDRAADARRAVLYRWLQMQPQAAAEFVSTLPPGPEREKMIGSTAMVLKYQSADVVVAWFRTLPASEKPTVKKVLLNPGISPAQREQLQTALKDAN